MTNKYLPYNCSAKVTLHTTINIFKKYFAVSLLVAVMPNSITLRIAKSNTASFFLLII